MTENSPSNQVVGVMDIGTSAIRTVIAELNSQGEIHHLENLQKPVPFGQDVFATGRISAQVMRQGLAVIKDMKGVLAGYGVQRMQAIATSAIREAANGDTFLDRIFVQTGIDVEIIEGPEENRLSLLAIDYALEGQISMEDRTCLIVEVGSGSSELIVLDRGRVRTTRTLSIGSLRLPEQAVAGKTESGLLKRILKRSIHNIATSPGSQSDLEEADTFIALGGDMRLMAKELLEEIPGGFGLIQKKEAVRFIEKIGKMSPEAIVSRYGLPYAHAQTFYSALQIYLAFFNETQAMQMVVPMVSIRDGLLVELAQMHSGYKRTDVSRQVINSARHIGKRYQFHKPHALNVSTLALKLFDQLVEDHGLGSKERLLLEVSAILHDIGTFISPMAHHKHSSYIVNAEDIFGLRKADKDIVANVVRYHRRSQPKSTHLPYMALTRADRVKVAKLAALLRVADALDKTHQQKINDFTLEHDGNTYILWVPAGVGDVAAERNALAKKGEMFADIFGMSVILKQRRGST